MGSTKKSFLLLTLLAMGTILAGCGQIKETILPMVVADKKGYFSQENLDVKLVRFQSAIEQENAMQSGAIDGMVTDMIVATLMKDSGQTIKMTSITLGITPKEGRFAMIAAPKSQINTLEDLKGKSLGIAFNSIIEYITDGLLENQGIDPSEVKKISLPKIPVRMEMLINNKIDAIVVPDPLVTFAEFKGARIIAQDTDQNLSQAVLVFNEKFLNQNKNALKSFYRAYAKAVNDLNNHPGDYQQLLIENVNIPEPIAQNYRIQHYPQPQSPTEEDIVPILQWMKKKNLLSHNWTYQDLVQQIQ